jgi:hypothetical protein
MRALLAIGVAILLTGQAAAEPNGGSDAWVSSPHGVNVHADASNGSRVVAVLWSGARVFVRETSGAFARIDGYGVAGYAYVDRAYIADRKPQAQSSAAAPTHARR